MKRLFRWLKAFFFPPHGSSRSRRILPYAIIVFAGILFFIALTEGWHYTNSTEFCGTSCHTMPPHFVTHLSSAHTRLTCEDCHLGRGKLPEQIVRKVEYSYYTGSAMVLNNYEFPITVKHMLPSRILCESCHYPLQFSNDTMVELLRYESDELNSLNYIYLILKTGGGSHREGLGYGIHWHVENPIYFYATDKFSQNIPYMRVQLGDGTVTEYIDIESGFDVNSISDDQLQQMDCVTCHNRIAHEIEPPNVIVDKLLGRGEISADIPEIKNQAVKLLSQVYATQEDASKAISDLAGYYRQNYEIFYNSNASLIESAIETLKIYYFRMNFPEQKMNWESHPNNSSHINTPGCFRCHDGKHFNSNGEAVRLECNICHSIPIVSSSRQFVTNIEISRGVEPENHRSTTWIHLHREYFDNTCQACHTVEDPGGVSNTSFCSNSGCHGITFEFAKFDAPGLRVILAEELKKYVTPTVVGAPHAINTPAPGELTGELFYSDIAFAFVTCTSCHGAGAIGGLDVSTYESLMLGGNSGPCIVPGKPEESLLVTIQTDATPHFGQFSPEELEAIMLWIQQGAKE